jgi:hypothetical protein
MHARRRSRYAHRVSEPLVVVQEAFAVRGSAVQVAPRITVDADGSPRGTFPVRLRLPDGTERSAIATLDVAHVRGPHGAYAMVRLLGLAPDDVPPGTAIWRE